MFDQLKIGDVYSHDTYGASVAERAISAPKKKVIKETVPFSNKTYDFSAINGELYWEERELRYVFEIIADSPEELEVKKSAFSGWVMNVMNENIYDPYDPDYHYVGTFEDIEFEDDDSVEKTTATVTFMVYPFKIANEAKIVTLTVSAQSEKSVTITNKSAHKSTVDISVAYSGTSSASYYCEGTVNGFTKRMYNNRTYTFPLELGDNEIVIGVPVNKTMNITISHKEEVF